MEEGIPDRRDSDRLRRPHRRLEQDVKAHRSRGGLDGVAAAMVDHPRKNLMLEGRRFYKMSGSGNDFVFFDLRDGPAGELETIEVIRALCARGTGIGADGVV